MWLTYLLGNPTLSQKFERMWHILGEGQTMWLQQHHRLPKWDVGERGARRVVWEPNVKGFISMLKKSDFWTLKIKQEEFTMQEVF